ncbi:hypothetical protein quinque_003037 [Culex quinquefasciatus]|uniref:uncharacterized protein LOC119769906 n=1 Tax=Culex quinquefasciatus TaxID=7176 RepID=UPI0018E3939C|nr:uncharacterized protein LOC119769906 [Culex quinquefasciatus]
MIFSQEDVVESSQSGESSSGRRGRGRRSNGSQSALPKRKSQRNQVQRQQQLPVDSADWSSSVLLEIPQSDTEESPAGNLSGSLFSGQQDLLRQYESHEQDLKKRDAMLEQVLEQSRKACEQLKLQNSSSQQATELFRCSEHPPANQPAISKEVSCQTSVNQQEAGVQCNQPKVILCNASVQLSPISQKRSSQNVATQSSPNGQPKRSRISTSTNTDDPQRENSSAQTTQIQTRDVAIQKYHSTRVREMAAQTDQVVVPKPKISRRNVSIQHRSTGTLDLGTANSVGLGIALRCDPARLQRVLFKMAAEQHNQSRGSSTNNSVVDTSGSMQDGGGLELFGPDEPYYANYEYFMEEERGDTDGGSTRGSEQEVSCFVEDDYNV